MSHVILFISESTAVASEACGSTDTVR